MKTKLISLIVLLVTPLLFMGDLAGQGQTTNTMKVTVEDIKIPGGVLGKLSLPLGTVVKLDGKIQSLPDSHPKSDEEFDWLLVDSVNGVTPKTPIPVGLRWFGPSEKANLRGRVSVVGYETGGFVGVPSAAFSYIPVVGSTGFHFETYFMVIKKL
jgi:hypothetical protein